MTDEGASAPRVSPEEVERRVTFADAAMRLAGHDVSEEWRELSRRVAAEELTGDEAVAIAMARISAREQ